jgi:hypothetical protein
MSGSFEKDDFKPKKVQYFRLPLSPELWVQKTSELILSATLSDLIIVILDRTE